MSKRQIQETPAGSPTHDIFNAYTDLTESEKASPEELRRRICIYEEIISQFEQIEIPVSQYFSCGIYVREITIPKNCYLTGKIHKHPCISIVMTGEMEVVTEAGPKIIKAGMIFESPAGVKRAGRALSDCRWLTIHPYNGEPRNEKEMADLITVDSFDLLENKVSPQADFQKMLTEFGFTEDIARAQSENCSDLEEIDVYGMLSVKKSDISGLGLFSNISYPPSAPIIPARINGKRTQAGRWVNHSPTPNAEMQFLNDNDIILFSVENINAGEEITTDYRKTLTLQGVKKP